jgi:4-hydroxymandelate oxidase
MLVSLRDWERAALARMSDEARDYVAEPAMDGRTHADNEAAFARRRLRPHVLTGAGEPDLSVHLLGRRWPHPVLLAPTARHGLVHPDGEGATARAAAARGVTMTVSTSSGLDLDAVVDALDHWWFQVYLLDDPGSREALVERAVQAGAEALVLTVDLADSGRREAPARAGRATFPTSVPAVNIARAAGVAPAESRAVAYKQPVTVDDVAWLTTFGVPVVVKGVLRGDDAARAVDAGAAAVQVSNHGGRQLDGAVASLDALEEVVAAVGADVPVLVDGGVRRGSDVLTALALGATAVGIGRPALWGLAVDGQDGVDTVLRILLDELEHVMRLAGIDYLDDVPRDLVTP